MSLGTPHYMSPEQAMGEREITARSDVYALGAMTYEMLLGEPPFTGPTAQAIVAKVMTEEPRPLTAQRKTVPEQVEDAVLTALAKLPADRWAVWWGGVGFFVVFWGGWDAPTLMLAISPDGSRIAYMGPDTSGWQIWVREVSSLTGRPIPGTHGAASPIFSPDGRALAFFTGSSGDLR